MSRYGRGVLALVLTVVQLSCNPSAPPASRSDTSLRSTRDGYVDAGEGVRLYYRTVGAGPDTLVVIHGGPGFNSEYLAEDLRSLSDNRRVIFYDQRGTGRSSLVSDAAALDAQRFAEDLEAIRRHFDLERLSILGHSWGAAVAALYAMRYPEQVERLLIVGGVPLRRSQVDRTFKELDDNRDAAVRIELQKRREKWHANPGDGNACRAYYTIWFQPFYGDRSEAARSKGDFCAGPAEALRNKVASVDRYTVASLGDWDWRTALRTVTARALVIHGTADVIPADTAREWAIALPKSRLLLLDGIGHFPYVEAPERFNAAVDKFMQGQWPEGSEIVSQP